MKIFKNPFSKKSATADDLERVVREAIGSLGGISASGVQVGDTIALRVAAVYACIKVLAESVAQLPLHVYVQDGESKKRAVDHPLYDVLANRPNSWQTSFEFRELMMVYLCLRGNAYAWINRVNGEIRELVPIHPDNVSISQNDDFSLEYTVNFKNKTEVYSQEDMFHIRGMTLNGVLGLSPISYARESIGLAVATEAHGSRLFKNGARPGGILSHPAKLSPEAATRLKASWQNATGGENQHGTAILEEGMKWNPMGLSNEDSQFLETRKFQVEEIARIFRVPLHMIQSTEKSTSWGSGIESLTLGFVKFSLLPWLKRWEQAISRDLFTKVERKKYYAEYLVEGMERASVETRYKSYGMAIQNGIMNPNEARRRENMDPRAGGDDFWKPSNMMGDKDEQE